MTRWAAVLASSLLAVVLVVLPAFGAAATEPPPPPVEPLKTLPSTYARTVYTGSSLADGNINLAAYALRQQRALQLAAEAGETAANAAKVADAVAITKAAPLVKAGAAGSLVTGGFMAGWMLTDGTLALYTTATGTNPMAGTCDQPDWAQAAIDVLYPFSSPDCIAPVLTPNSDVTAGWSTFTYAGNSYGIKSLYGTTDVCVYKVTGTVLRTARMIFTTGPPGLFTWPSTSWSGCGGSDANAVGGLSGKTLVRIELYENVGGVDTIRGSSQQTTADPGRVPECRLTWPDATTTTTTGTTSYTEAGGIPVGAFESLCNEGFVSKPGHGPDLLPTEVEIGSVKEGGTYNPIQEAPVPEYTPDEKKGLTPGTSGGLVLQKVVGVTTSSCMTWDIDCSGWWEATEDGTVPSTTTGTYRCTWNGSTVSLSECGVHRNTFETPTSTPTITDPVTGQESPWVSGQPNPTNSINPGTGPGTSPGDACMASWPVNPDPLSWVLHPVKCALVWAFVPRQAVITGTVTGLGTAAGEVAAVDPLLALITELPSGSGCDGIPIELTFFGTGFEGRLLEACSGPGAAAAAVVNGLLTLALITAAVFQIGRYGAAVFGFVGPGGSMEHAQRQTEREIERQDRGVRFH